MKTRLLLLLTLVISLTSLASCSLILSSAYGIKGVKTIDEKTIILYGNKYDIPISNIYELDTSYYSFLRSEKTKNNSIRIKDHYQPLQALYFDSTGYAQSYQVNCWAGGFPNLNWDRDSILTTFPPKMQAPLDSLLTLDLQLSFLQPLSVTGSFSVQDYDWVVVVYWNRYMGRQSKRFVRVIQDNSELESKSKVKIIYVNNDNIEKGSR
jgi:hypothetical protein